MDYLLFFNYRSSIFLNFNSEDDTSSVEEIDADVMITEFDEKGETEEKCGYLHLHYYNVAFATNNNMNIFDAFDRSMNTIEMGETIINPYTGEIKDEIKDQIGDPFGSNILVIQDFGIFPRFRNKGLGKR